MPGTLAQPIDQRELKGQRKAVARQDQGGTQGNQCDKQSQQAREIVDQAKPGHQPGQATRWRALRRGQGREQRDQQDQPNPF